MTRVSVIGNAGGGKSTLSRTICKAYNLPYFEIDKMQWQANWVPTPEEIYTKTHKTALNNKTWLIDGFGSWASIEERFAQSDTIIFIDHPFWRHIWWATKRQIKSIFKPRPDGPENCPMLPMTFKLYKMMWYVHKKTRPKLLELIAQSPETTRIIHIQSPRELKKFIDNPI